MSKDNALKMLCRYFGLLRDAERLNAAGLNDEHPLVLALRNEAHEMQRVLGV